MKVPQLRNMYEKTGFDQTSMSNNRGFGYTHDGAVDSLFNFLFFDGFTFVNGQQRLDVEAFVMCFTSDTHAGTGTQAMLPDPGTADQPAVFTDLVSVAGSPELELIVKGIFFGETRGLRMLPGGVFQSDRASQTVTLLDLINAAGPGSELTFTLVPAGSGERLGVDRDEDGFLDRDELDAGSNPADPISTPDNVGDLDGDGMVGIVDLLALLAGWGPCPGPPLPCPTDLDGDGSTGITDLLVLLANWG